MWIYNDGEEGGSLGTLYIDVKYKNNDLCGEISLLKVNRNEFIYLNSMETYVYLCNMNTYLVDNRHTSNDRQTFDPYQKRKQIIPQRSR